ncbi:hypothetical protein ACIOGZ_11545 [Kitasatospora sp. NPDC088160]|uniref:hypothetical protein n=1 Tax=Kitasatospora sp. NPDC088160 TaxID=3364072 RepID=UPI0038023CD0
MDERSAPDADPAEQAPRHLLAGLTTVRDGDFATRLAPEQPGMLGEIATSLAGGADDHVTEPVDTRHLLGRMQYWLDTP